MHKQPDRAVPQQTGAADRAVFRAYRAAFFAMPFCGGLLFSRAWVACCAVNLVFLCRQCRSAKAMKLPAALWPNICTVTLASGAAGAFVCGIDRGGAYEGAAWMLSVLIFALLLRQWSPEQRQSLCGQLPAMGAVMVLLCIAGRFVPALRRMLYENGRMAGPFQYANTFAVFLLVCLVLYHDREPKLSGGVALFVYAVLLAGIAGTASRGTLALLLLWLLYITARRRWSRALAGGLAVIAAGSLLFLVLGRVPRLVQRMTEADPFTTLTGRLLYWKDGIRVLWQHPMGVGRLGWLYLQGMVQSGAYNVRFVHNDLLQLALDYGIVPAAAALYFVIRRLAGAPIGRQAAWILVVHSLFEWDMQFQFVLFLLLLLLSQQTPAREAKKHFYLPMAVLAGLTALILPIGLADLLAGTGQLQAAHGVNPWDTDIAVRWMLEQPALPQAAAAAQRILAGNIYEETSWRVLAEAAAGKGQYETAMAAMRQAVVLRKYDQQTYDEAMQKCLTALDNGVSAETVCEQMTWLVGKMQQTAAETDPLARFLPEQPDLSFSEELLLQTRLLERLTAAA